MNWRVYRQVKTEKCTQLETQLVVVAGEGPKGNGRRVFASIFLVFWNASCLALRRVRVYWLAANTPRHH